MLEMDRMKESELCVTPAKYANPDWPNPNSLEPTGPSNGADGDGPLTALISIALLK
jgi:hypothetical protein